MTDYDGNGNLDVGRSEDRCVVESIGPALWRQHDALDKHL